MTFIEEFELSMKRHDLSKNTIGSTLYDIKDLCDFLKTEPKNLTKDSINSITEYQIETYINYLKESFKSTTALRRKVSLQKLLKFSGSDKIKFLSQEMKIKKVEPDTYFPTDEEVQELYEDVMENGNPMQRLIMDIIKNTGMRIGEVEKLNVSDIDFEKLEIRLYDTKNHKDRKLPVNKKLVNHIKKYIKKDRYELREQFKKDGDALFVSTKGRRHSGIGLLMRPFYNRHGFTTHGVRKQVSTKIYKITGCDAKTTSHFMGNTPETLLKHYIKVDKEKLESIRKYI